MESLSLVSKWLRHQVKRAERVEDQATEQGSAKKKPERQYCNEN